MGTLLRSRRTLYISFPRLCIRRHRGRAVWCKPDSTVGQLADLQSVRILVLQLFRSAMGKLTWASTERKPGRSGVAERDGNFDRLAFVFIRGLQPRKQVALHDEPDPGYPVATA